MMHGAVVLRTLNSNRAGFVFVQEDEIWKRKKLNGHNRYKWADGTEIEETMSFPIQFLENGQRSFSRQEIGDDCDGVICFVDKCDGSDLILCAKLGKDKFCPLDLPADGKHVRCSKTKNTIKKEKNFVQYNVNQISGNNQWQHKPSTHLRHTINKNDNQIQENKRGPDVCPGFGNGTKKRKERDETEEEKQERNRKSRIFQKHGVDSAVHDAYGTHIGLKKKALVLDESGKSYRGRFIIPNPNQIDQDEMDFMFPPCGTQVNVLKKMKKHFSSPDDAEEELSSWCEPVRLEVLDANDFDIQYFTNENNQVISAFVGSKMAEDLIHNKLKKSDTEEFFSSAEKVSDGAVRNCTKAGGFQLFGPVPKTAQAGTFATKGSPEERKGGLIRPRPTDYERKGNNKEEHARHSQLLKKFGDAAARAQNKYLPFQMFGNNSYTGGFDCEINIQTILFYNTIHQDPDKRRKEQQQKLKERISKLEEKLNNMERNKDELKEYIAAQKGMVQDTFTTCTWLLEEKDEWELFVYFIFPASRIALRLTHKCALTFKGYSIYHGTSVTAAINKTTKEVRFLTDGDKSFGVVNAWGKG
mmetsp:Transcript_28170/g.39618  ORF Transcript_28170/g.39618 Transcript_28170/m.39618 type:complete len:584 (-) Transcript_28170:775-2526(-)